MPSQTTAAEAKSREVHWILKPHIHSSRGTIRPVILNWGYLIQSSVIRVFFSIFRNHLQVVVKRVQTRMANFSGLLFLTARAPLKKQMIPLQMMMTLITIEKLEESKGKHLN